MAKKNILLLVFVVILAIIPILFNKGAEFGGADGEAEEAIGEINPGYQPWFQSIWEPPSGEIESQIDAHGHGLAVIKIVAIAGFGFQRMAEGVTKI